MNKNSTSLRLVAHLDPPLVNDCFETYPHGKCYYPGYEIEYIYTVLNGILRMGVNWTKVESLDEAAFYLETDKADMIANSLFVDDEYVGKWGFPPSSFLYDSFALLVRERTTRNQSHLFSLLRSFTWDLWSSMIGVTLIALLLRKTSKCLYRRDRARARESTVTLRCGAKTRRSIVRNFSANVWYSICFLFISLLLNFYSNSIAVDLIAPDSVKDIPFKSFNDLGEKLLSKQCRFVIQEKYADYKELYNYLLRPLQFNKTWAKLFAKAFKANPPLYVANRDELVAVVMNNTCYVGVDWSTMGAYYQTRYCEMRVLTFPEELPLFGYTYYTSHREIIDQLSTVITSGAFQAYTDYLTEKYYSQRIPVDCSKHVADTKSSTTVNLSKMKDSFLFLGIGILMAFLMGLYQHWARKCNARRENES